MTSHKTPKQAEDEPDLFPTGDSMRQTRTSDEKTMKKASSNIVSFADENMMKINPITVDDKNRMKFHPSENFDISQLELLLQHNSTKHYKFIQKTLSNTTVSNTMSPVNGGLLIAVQKGNSDI